MNEPEKIPAVPDSQGELFPRNDKVQPTIDSARQRFRDRMEDSGMPGVPEDGDESL